MSIMYSHFRRIARHWFSKVWVPHNRTISAARDISLKSIEDEYLALPSQERFGLTRDEISEIDAIPASPLHSYTCVFRWYMILVYIYIQAQQNGHQHQSKCETH